jgi:hypothetical protein
VGRIREVSRAAGHFLATHQICIRSAVGRPKVLIINQQGLRFQKDRGMQIAGENGRGGMSHNHTTRKLRSLCVKYYGKVTVEGVITTHLLRTTYLAEVSSLEP